MTRLLSILFLLMLAACAAGGSQPFGKLEPAERTSAIISPPWEAMIAAGPGASKEIDLETLNGPGRQQAAAATPEDIAADAKSGRLVIRA